MDLFCRFYYAEIVPALTTNPYVSLETAWLELSPWFAALCS